MSTRSPHTDYFSINSTKIYSANPSGNFTVTSLPLTSRHLQDLESPSYYNLLFDLIANKFSKTPLHRRPSPQIITTSETSTKLSGHRRPTLSATKSAEAVLTPQRREHQQSRGCTKLALNHNRSIGALPRTRKSVLETTHQQQRPQSSNANSSDKPLASPGRARSRHSPYESPPRIAARSVGALLTFPEHTHHEHYTEVHHRPSRSSASPAEVVLPRHNTILSGVHRLHPNATKPADPVLAPQPRVCQQQASSRHRPPQRISSLDLSSTTALPAPAMAPERPHHLDPDGPDPFTAFGNPHQKTTLSPHKAAIFSIRNAKKAARIRAAEQKQKERSEKAAKKIGRENAEAAKCAQREQTEAADKMKRLEKDAEKQRLRREEQAANMEKKRRREEEKERVMEVRRHKRALGGMSWGFDPGAGTRASRESGSGSGNAEVSGAEEGAASGEFQDLGFHRVRRGTTWGVTRGGPGRIGGYHGADVNRP